MLHPSHKPISPIDPVRLNDGHVPRNFVAEYAAKLVDQGYRILPLIPAAKKPGEWLGNRWRPMSLWSRFCDRKPTDLELSTWSSWPGTGVGIACGHTVGIDLDVLDEHYAEAFQRKAFSELGETPVVRIGMAPKRLLVYRAAEPLTPIKLHPLELLAYGNQFVAYGIHPVTTLPYAWPYDDLLDVAQTNLPLITQDQAQRFLAQAYEALPSDMRQRRLGPDLGSEVYFERGTADQRGTIEAISDALPWIPNDDLDYDSWIKIGMALKGAVGDDGASLWANWSAQSNKKNRVFETAKAWRSFKPTKTGAGSIYWYAGQNGWRPDFSITLNAAKAESSGAADALIAALATKEPVRAETIIDQQPLEPSSLPIPTALASATVDPLQPDGLLQQILEEGLKCARRRQPNLMLGAAIALVGTLAGRRYVGPTGIHPNVYIGLLAPSTAGKEHPQAFVSEVLALADQGQLLGGRELTSDAALERATHVFPTRLFIFDELARILKPMLSDNDNNRVSASAATWLMTAYTKAGGILLGKEYANPGNTLGQGQQRRDINNPCVSILGATNEVGLWDTAGERAMRDGFIGRWLFFVAPSRFPPPNRGANGMAISDDLIAKAKAIREGAAGHDYGISDVAVMRAKPYPVPIDEDARAWIEDLEDQQIERQNQLGTADMTAALFGRLVEQTHKLALIHAVSMDPARPRITMASAQWAYAVALASVEFVAAKATNDMAESDFARLARKAHAYIIEHHSVQQQKLIRYMKIPSKQLAEITEHLMAAGKILVIQAESKDRMGRPALAFLPQNGTGEGSRKSDA